jgi:hypothetical protein
MRKLILNMLCCEQKILQTGGAAVMRWRRGLFHVGLVPDGAGLDAFTISLKNDLNLIMIFGFFMGCGMVMTGFLRGKRDENWKWRSFAASAYPVPWALMKVMSGMLGGAASSAVTKI